MTDGERGLLGIWVRRTWRRRLHALGASEVEGTLVVKPGNERGDSIRTAEALGWERHDGHRRALSRPVMLEMMDEEWRLSWL